MYSHRMLSGPKRGLVVGWIGRRRRGPIFRLAVFDRRCRGLGMEEEGGPTNAEAEVMVIRSRCLAISLTVCLRKRATAEEAADPRYPLSPAHSPATCVREREEHYK